MSDNNLTNEFLIKANSVDNALDGVINKTKTATDGVKKYNNALSDDQLLRKLREIQRAFELQGNKTSASWVKDFSKNYAQDIDYAKGKIEEFKNSLSGISSAQANAFASASLSTDEGKWVGAISEIQSKLKNLGYKDVVKDLEEFKIKHNNTMENVEDDIKEVRNAIEQNLGSDALDEFDKALDKTQSKSLTLKDRLGENFREIGKTLKMGTIISAIRRSWNSISEVIKAGNDLVETENLFAVSFGKGIEGQNKYYEQAVNFQEKLVNKLGVNANESMNYQALFNSISKSMGLDNEVAYTISENFTKLGYDLASLYNTSTESAMQKLQSGLSGSSTRPLRAYGIDITQATLANTLSDLGIERKISSLSQAEKMVLRYIAVLKQSSIAHGDFARTIESPANQIRIFQARVLALKQALGGLFQGVLQKILPYINAILKAIASFISKLAGLFGIKMQATVSNVSGNISDIEDATEGIKDGVGGTGGALDDANKKAKEFKKTLMGFDVLNVITTPTPTSSSGSGGSGGGGGGGGIDPALLDAFDLATEGYDNLMDGIKEKARKALDYLEAFGLALGGLTISKGVMDFLKALGIISEKTNTLAKAFDVAFIIGGFYLTYKGMRKMFDGDMSISTLLETFIGASFGTFGVVRLFTKATLAQAIKIAIPLAFDFTIVWFGIQSIRKNFAEMKEMIYGEVENLGIAETLNVALTAIGKEAYEVMQRFWENIFAFKTNNASMKEAINVINDYKNSYLDTISSIEDTKNAKISEIEATKSLVNELGRYIGANGEVREGNEELARTILNDVNRALGTEYELDGRNIKNKEGVILKYQDLQNEISETIKKLREQAEAEALTEVYKEAVKTRIEAQQKQMYYLEKINALTKDKKKLTTEEKVELQSYTDALNATTETLSIASQTQANTAVEIAKAEAKKRQEMETTANTANTTTSNIIEASEKTKNQLITDATNSIDNLIAENARAEETVRNSQLANLAKTLSVSTHDEFMSEINKLDDETSGELLAVYSITQGWTPNCQEAFNNLGEAGRSAYDAKISEITGATSSAITDATDTAKEGLKGEFVTGIEDGASDAKRQLEPSLSNILGNWDLAVNMSFNVVANVVKKIGKAVMGQYASGGLVDEGQLFIAREAGAELVGNIGGRTAVMNNDQIVNSVSKGVATAVASVMSNYQGGNSVNKFYFSGRETQAVVEKQDKRVSNIFGR